jgi:hypothetical protein
MASESGGGGATTTGANAGWAAGAAAGAVAVTGAVVFFGCGVGAGGWVCNSLSFFSNASRSLRSASASAAQSGSRARQYAAAQATRKDLEICMRAFLR